MAGKVHANEYSIPKLHESIQTVDIFTMPTVSVGVMPTVSAVVDFSTMPTLSVEISSVPTIDIGSMPVVAMDFSTMPTLSIEVGKANLPFGAVATTRSQDANSVANIINIAPVSGMTHYVTGFEAILYGGVASVSGGTDLNVQILNGSTVVWKTLIGYLASRGENRGAMFAKPIACTLEATLSIQADAGGPSTGTTLNISYFTL